MSGACDYCGRPTRYGSDGKYHVHDGSPADMMTDSDENPTVVWVPTCTNRQWSDDRYIAEKQAYLDGEYDGYWGDPQRVGTWSNTEWAAYLRGYLAGVKDRNSDATDEACVAFAEQVAKDVAGGER